MMPALVILHRTRLVSEEETLLFSHPSMRLIYVYDWFSVYKSTLRTLYF